MESWIRYPFCTTTNLSHSDDICSRTAHKLKLQANWQAAVAVAVNVTVTVDVALLCFVALKVVQVVQMVQCWLKALLSTTFDCNFDFSLLSCCSTAVTTAISVLFHTT